jgi:hypothetical protein
MKTIKATKLREVLSSKGVDEGFIDRIFHRIEKLKPTTNLNKLKKTLKRLNKGLYR